MKFTLGTRIHFLRFFISECGSACSRPVAWIFILSVFSAAAFGAAPFFLSIWVSLLAKSVQGADWVHFFGLYLLSYGLAFASRDVQWCFYTRIESTVFSSITHNLTLRSIHGNGSNGVGLLTQTLQGAQSLLFCGFFILMPALFETVSMLIAIVGTAPFWMVIPLLLHTVGYLFLIDFSTRRMALHQKLINPHAARVLDLVGALFGERPLLQRYAAFGLTDQVLKVPVQNRESERLRMGWTRTWTTTLLNLLSLIGLTANLAMALWFYSRGEMTVGEVVAVESIFFLVLRRLEMWSRGYRETGQAVEQCRDGVAVISNIHKEELSHADIDDFKNDIWNVLMGRTGSGKSTWLLNRWKRSAYQPAFLPQRPEILPGTIRFNLTLGNRDVDVLLPKMLCEMNLENTLQRLPDGLDTELLQGQSCPLSGGELQRLCLARVLLHWKGDELLLDEPTSAQSVIEAAQVFHALKRLTQGKTVWVASHQSEVKQWADKLWECTGWNQVIERDK